jgi:hypothetical protein
MYGQHLEAYASADGHYTVRMTAVANGGTLALTSSTNGSSSTVPNRTCRWWITTPSWWPRMRTSQSSLTVDGVHPKVAGYAVMACWSRPRSRLIREVMKEGRPVDSVLRSFSDPSHELVQTDTMGLGEMPSTMNADSTIPPRFPKFHAAAWCAGKACNESFFETP